MCGRYTETAAFEELARRFGIEVEEADNEELISRYNVSPSQAVPIIVATEGRRRHLRARWGLRPHWTRDGKVAPINARAETLATSPMFRDALKYARCLVPADGFYEWQAVPGQKRKQPWYLRLRGGGLFAFAGLYTAPHPDAGVPSPPRPMSWRRASTTACRRSSTPKRRRAGWTAGSSTRGISCPSWARTRPIGWRPTRSRPSSRRPATTARPSWSPSWPEPVGGAEWHSSRGYLAARRTPMQRSEPP